MSSNDFQITNEEYKKLKENFKNKEFRDYFLQYMNDLSDPAYRAEQEKYFAQLAQESNENAKINTSLGQPTLGSDRRIIVPKGEFGLSIPLEESSNDSKDSKNTNKIYINICSSEFISKYETVPMKNSFSANYRIPLSLGREYDEDGALTYDIVFHPDTVTDARRDSFLLKSIFDISCEYIENHYKKKLSRLGDHYNVTLEKKVRGNPLAQTVKLQPTHEQEIGKSVNSTSLASSNATTANSSTTSSKISKTPLNNQKKTYPTTNISNTPPSTTSTNNQKLNDYNESNSSNSDQIKVDQHVKKLIEDALKQEPENIKQQQDEISDTIYNSFSNAIVGESNFDSERTTLNLPGAPRKQIGAIEEVEPQYTTPEYVIIHSGSFKMQDHILSQVDADRKIPEKLVVKMKLPKLSSAKTIELDITTQNLFLSEPTFNYQLNLSLPYPVDSDEGSAKFDRKTKEMIVTLPVNIPKDQLLVQHKPKWEQEEVPIVNLNEEHEKERQEAIKKYQDKLEEQKLEKQRELEISLKKQKKREEQERILKEEQRKKEIEEDNIKKENIKKQEENQRKEDEVLRQLLQDNTKSTKKDLIKSVNKNTEVKKVDESTKENITPDEADEATLRDMKLAKEKSLTNSKNNKSEEGATYESQYFNFEFENKYLSEID